MGSHWANAIKRSNTRLERLENIIKSRDELRERILEEIKKQGEAHIDLNHLDVSHVTDMFGIFEGCSSIVSLDITSWDVSNVVNMSGMFLGCESLTSLDLSSWNTARVENTDAMFCNCFSLANLNISGWQLPHLMTKDYMFWNCPVGGLEDVVVED